VKSLTGAAALVVLLSASVRIDAVPPGTPAKPRAFLLVTIDTWRWDYLGVAGRTAIRTPNLDRLAKEGAYLPRVHATAPLTAPSHASILTGLDPFRHGVRDNIHFRLDPKVPTLPEVFRKRGFQTAAFVSATPLRRSIGLDRGFAVYDDRELSAAKDESFSNAERRADVTTSRALAWLKTAPPRQPLFLWVHYYDPHQPYRSGSSASVKGAASGYAGEIEFVDRELGRLLQVMGSTYTLAVAATGDHGEGLGDHGESTHGNALYETTLSVPLILWPRPEQLAKAPASPASLVDVAPTVADWMGMGRFPGDGRSLLGAEREKARFLYGESLSSTFSFGVSPAYALRRGGSVAILHGATEVFDTDRDAEQKADLAASGPGLAFAGEARSELARILRKYPEELLRKPTGAAGPEEVQKLRSLGYISGGAGARSKPWKIVDRRVLLRHLDLLSLAQDNFTRGKLNEAAVGFEAFLGHYPDSAFAHQQYALTLVRRNDLPGAARQFAKALELDPDDPVSSLSMGNLAAMKGDLPAAERFFLASLRAEADQPEALLNLGEVYLALGKLERARPLITRFLELSPNDTEAPRLRAILEKR